MKRNIKAIYLKYLNGETHYKYMFDFNSLLVEFPIAKGAITAYYTTFTSQLAQEKTIVDAQKSSIYTKQIAEADSINDNLTTGIRETVSAAMHHFDPVTAEAGRKLFLRMKAFGEIQTKSYEAEAAAIDILLSDLDSEEYLAAVEAVRLEPWLVKLAVSLQEFNRLLTLRNAETSGKPKQQQSDIRKQIDTTYRSMITVLESNSVLNYNIYAPFIGRLNTLVTYYNDHNGRPARKQIRLAAIDQIPEQIYTGKAITPIPTIHFDDKELFFARDFDLTYKDNEKPGTATVSIRGKGNYTGLKKVTFTIIQ
jgi:hypothetical protein